MNSDSSDLFEQFTRLNWLLHRYHQQNHREFGPMGDTHRGQGRILALLKLKPEISQKELSSILDIRSQSLGELLSKLEKSGYIARTPSEADRRVMEIRLTEAGKEASTRSEQQLDTEALFQDLNEEEQAALSDYLNRIISTLEQLFGNSDSEYDFTNHPPFEGRGFGPHPGMRDGRPPFAGGGFGHWPDRGERRPPFDFRDFGCRPDPKDKNDDSD